METPRPITWHRHDDGIDQWCMANAPPHPTPAGRVLGYSDYSERTASFTTRRELPTTRAVLIVNLGARLDLIGGNGEALSLGAGQGFVAGLHTAPARSRSGGAQSGIHAFLPLAGLHRLLGADMDAITDRVVDLAAIFGETGRDLGRKLGEAPDGPARFDILEQALRTRLGQTESRARRTDRVIDWAALRLARNPALAVETLARDIGWSRKHLATLFRRRLGAGPRLYARLLRFERVMRALDTHKRPDWPGIALSAGYADQAHMIRDVRAFSLWTPTTLASRMLPDGGGLIEA